MSCSLCGTPNVNMLTCPLNKEATNPNMETHYKIRDQPHYVFPKPQSREVLEMMESRLRFDPDLAYNILKAGPVTDRLIKYLPFETVTSLWYLPSIKSAANRLVTWIKRKYPDNPVVKFYKDDDKALLEIGYFLNNYEYWGFTGVLEQKNGFKMRNITIYITSTLDKVLWKYNLQLYRKFGPAEDVGA